MTTYMPTRNQKSAPRFNPKNPRSLRRYFADLAHLFVQHNVSDDQQKKRHATTYVDIDTEDFWRVIPEYKPPASFETFRDAIFKYYPGADDEYRISDLENLVAEQARVEIENREDLAAYYRKFGALSSSLLETRRVSSIFVNRIFVRGFQPSLWLRIEKRL
jgi:hypothetical protein